MSYLALYKVNNNIEKILKDLLFKKTNSELESWKLYTREFSEELIKDAKNYFTALYNVNDSNRNIVFGTYKNLDNTKEDLEKLTNLFYNKPMLSRIIRTRHYNIAQGFIFASIAGYAAYHFLVGSLIFIPLAGVACGTIIPMVYSLTMDALNDSKISNISPEAQNYSFGKYAEYKLKRYHKGKQLLEKR